MNRVKKVTLISLTIVITNQFSTIQISLIVSRKEGLKESFALKKNTFKSANTSKILALKDLRDRDLINCLFTVFYFTEATVCICATLPGWAGWRNASTLGESSEIVRGRATN